MMYEGWTKDYKKYKNLFYYEYNIVEEYHCDFNPTRLGKYIRENGSHITPSMWDFLEDVLAGRITRKSGQKKSHTARDINIFIEVYRLMRGGHRLTSNRDKSGAASIVAEKYSLSEWKIKEIKGSASLINEAIRCIL